MDLKQFKKLIKKVEKLDEEPEFYGKVSLQDIEKVAQALNLKFDDQITTYLQEFGGGGIPDILNTNGIIPENPLSDNILHYLERQYMQEQNLVYPKISL